MSGPDTRHPEYVSASAKWQKCRDVIEGEDAIHKAGEAYLPALSDQKPAEYQAYVMRTPFYNATSRTVDGLVGMVLRKPPVVDAPASLDAIRADMTLSGCGLEELSEQLLREVCVVARVGLLVEYPTQIVGPLTEAQAAAMNRRPYVALYQAEHIINWRVERVNNAVQPVMVVLSETVTVWESDFESSDIEQRRALLLEDGVYLQRIYQKPKTANEWVQVGPDVVPLMNNAPLTYIPFVMFGPQRNDFSCQKPPVYDLVTLNLSHYRTIADYEHGAHFTGLPTPFLAGVQLEDGEKIRIGSSEAITSPDPQAKAMYLEFSGQGLGALKDRAAEKEAGMAAIGARMLAPEKAGVEAEGTLALRHSGESAVLATIANMVGAGLTRVLQIMADWIGADTEVSVTMNTDFAGLSMPPQQIDALVAAWQRGAISRETMFDNFLRGEVIPEGRDFETESASIDNQAPVLGVEPGETGEPGTSMVTAEARELGPPQVIDFAPFLEAIRSIPAPIVNVTADVPQPQITVNSAPVTNVEGATLEAQPPQAPTPVIVNFERPVGIKFEENADGDITGATLIFDEKTAAVEAA